MARRRHSTTSGPAPLPWVRWAPRASLCHTCTTTTATTTCHRRSSSRSRCLPRAQSGSPSLRLRCRSRLSTAPRRRCRMPRRRTASRHRRRLTSRAAPRLRTFCLLSLSPVMCGCAHLCWNLRRRATFFHLCSMLVGDGQLPPRSPPRCAGAGAGCAVRSAALRAWQAIYARTRTHHATARANIQEPLKACRACGMTKTLQWRKGPDGTPSYVFYVSFAPIRRR